MPVNSIYVNAYSLIRDNALSVPVIQPILLSIDSPSGGLT